MNEEYLNLSSYKQSRHLNRSMNNKERAKVKSICVTFFDKETKLQPLHRLMHAAFINLLKHPAL
jgi:hypothetical protein